MTYEEQEKQFGDQMRALGHDVVEITKKDKRQYTEHIDYIIDGIKIDFKGSKFLRRGDSVKLADSAWVEWQAVHSPYGQKNRIGWVRGNAKWIVMKDEDTLIWVDRAELEILVSKVDWKNFLINSGYDKHYQAIRRVTRQFGEDDDRDDLFCLVPKADILGLPSTKISLDMPKTV